MKFKDIYSNRFTERDVSSKNNVRKILCNDFFAGFVPKDSIIVDLWAWYCEFINNIKWKRKIAIDLNEDIVKYANKDVEVINDSCFAIKSLNDESIDVVFVSNFLEHLWDKQEILETLKEIKRILKRGGKILILWPNIRFLFDEYRDFFDHNVPLSDRSLIEILEILGMRIVESYPKFLPYTTKSSLPQNPIFVTLYLKFPILRKIFGKQFFIVAEK